jgi:predicted RNA-binding Zn-ribbon protein involved in translation (DUF1610 family)
VVEVVLVLLTVVAVTAAMAIAPGRLRARAGRRLTGSAPARRAPRPAARSAFLAVCSSCLEMVETDRALHSCPSCGAELAVRRRIQTAAGRSSTPVGR